MEDWILSPGTDVPVPLRLLAAVSVAAGERSALPGVSVSTRLRLRLTLSPSLEVPSVSWWWKRTRVSRVLTPLQPQRLGALATAVASLPLVFCALAGAEVLSVTPEV